MNKVSLLLTIFSCNTLANDLSNDFNSVDIKSRPFLNNKNHKIQNTRIKHIKEVPTFQSIMIEDSTGYESIHCDQVHDHDSANEEKR